jgi:protein AroM
MSINSHEPVLGLVTIGQSPRDDVLPQMLAHLPEHLVIRQAGALDGLSQQQLAQLEPQGNDYVLHTRLRDGSSVTIARRHIDALVQGAIDRLEQDGVDLILLLCTGEFPGLHSRVLLVELDRLLLHVVTGLGPRRMAMFEPLASQIEDATHKWGEVGAEAIYVAASPYQQPSTVGEAALELIDLPLDLIVMDCAGYTEEHRHLVQKVLKAPVVLASSLSARVLAELLHR